jgi:hypothetical protein
MAFALMAASAMASTLSACAPSEAASVSDTTSSSSSTSTSDSDTTQKEYQDLLDKAKSAVNDPNTQNKLKELKEKAKALKDSDEAKDAKSKIESYLNDLDSGSSAGTSSTGSTSAFGDVSKAQALSDLQSVKSESAQSVHYQRSEWMKTWNAYGKSCWSVRDQTIVNQAQSAQVSSDGCSVQSMSLTDPYTGTVFTSSSQVDIDHVVPLGYVATHGGQSWSSQKKNEYANDMTAGHLIAVSSSANRAKSDSGPSEWMPSTNQCAYGEDFVGVLKKWNISIEPSDKTFLENLIVSCAS